MKLYVTHHSPYARMTRIVVREKGLGGRIDEIVAQTRVPDSPYYKINPSGRVPYLVRDDGTGMEDSGLICDYLDGLDNTPLFARHDGDDFWESARLEALARSLMDGVSVWIRELVRPATDRSQTIMEHEIARSRRLTEVWEREIETPLMNGTFNVAQLTLLCALQLDAWNPRFAWRADCPMLASWIERFEDWPSVVETVAPSPIASD